MPRKSFIVSSVQLNISDTDSKAQRLDEIESIIGNLKGVDLVVLPEIWGTGYFNFDRYHLESEQLDGETVTRMASLAKKKNIYLLAGSIIEQAEDGYYNTSVFLSPQGEVLGTYRKMHLFGYGSAETKVLKRGDQVVTIKTELGTFGLSTCYDIRFPELYRRQVDQGAHFFLVCTAWPYPRLEHWNMLNHVRAFENQAYLISSNCCGFSQGKQFLGHSKIVDPWGIAIGAAGDFPGVITAEVSLKVVEEARQEFPALHDRILTD